MKTARDSLLLEVLTLMKSPYSESLKIDIDNVIARYRIQAKPDVVLHPNKTARETLGEAILSDFHLIDELNIENKIKQVVDGYRMQFKQNISPKEKKEANSASKNPQKAADVVESKPKIAQTISFGSKKDGGPIAGGPKKRQYSRSECPKCHSMGVVLARASSGDGYFSCIYCGFQAYQGKLDSDLDIPLAAQLLGRRFDEEKDIEELEMGS